MFVKTNVLLRPFFVLLLVPLWIFLRSVYRDRIGAFGCFDDCFNYMGGYFLLAGKRLFSEVFFNHMPLMAYISSAIQFVTKPDSLYMLLYQHRMFMIYAAIVSDIVLVLRFGFAGFGFAVLYESTKGFLFGERFLAEGLIIYPVAYLFGVSWERLRGKRIAFFELLVTAILTWFVVFMREPYIPLAVALFAVIIWSKRAIVASRLTVVFLIALSLLMIFAHDHSEFWFNVVTVNMQSVMATEAAAANLRGLGILQIFLYPFTVYFGGQWNMFRLVEASLAGVLILVGLLAYIRVPAYRRRVVFAFLILGLANVRPVVPGTVYYGMFHHIQWYGLAIIALLFLLEDLWNRRIFRAFVTGSIVLFAAICIWMLVSPGSYLGERVNRQTEITTNYAQYYAPGETVRRLSDEKDTLFLEEWDDLIYWQAKRLSPYRYAWYTSVMPQFEKYRSAREEMFEKNPPTFYYGKCTGDALSSLPKYEEKNYIRLQAAGKPSCLWVLRTKYDNITPDQWRSVEEFQYAYK